MDELNGVSLISSSEETYARFGGKGKGRKSKDLYGWAVLMPRLGVAPLCMPSRALRCQDATHQMHVSFTLRERRKYRLRNKIHHFLAHANARSIPHKNGDATVWQPIYVCSIMIPIPHLQVAEPCAFDEYGGLHTTLKPTMSSQ